MDSGVHNYNGRNHQWIVAIAFARRNRTSAATGRGRLTRLSLPGLNVSPTRAVHWKS